MKNIIFDLYGTLIDIHTDENSLVFWNEFAKKTRRYNINYTSNQLKDKYEELCKKESYNKEEIDVIDVFQSLFDVNQKIAKRIAHKFRNLSTTYVQLYYGVNSLLKKLKKEGFNLYILSNAQEAFTIPELKKLGILKYFKGIAISSCYSVKKPNEEFFRKALNDFHITEALMIGNEYDCDIEPAKKLGLKALYIESNLTYKKDKIPDVRGFNMVELYNEICKRILI